jgi:D-alanine transfer protein
MSLREPLRFLIVELGIGILAIFCAWQVFSHRSRPAHRVVRQDVVLNPGMYFPNPLSDPITSRAALDHHLKNGELVILGSSELTTGVEVAPERLFPEACGKSVVSFGSAGFQSLLILLLLAESRANLNPNSKIAIILSPGWFAERGTPSGAFLRFTAPHTIAHLLRDPNLPKEVRTALAREARMRRDEFTGLYPDWLYALIPPLAQLETEREENISLGSIKVMPVPEAKKFDWDLAIEKWKQDHIALTKGNPFGVYAPYYEKIKSSNPPYSWKVVDIFRTEMKDLFSISQFLKSYGIHAHFILQPVNRRILTELGSFERLFPQVEAQLKRDGHTWKSYFELPYDINILRDSGHFSKYAWVKIQKDLCLQ